MILILIPGFIQAEGKEISFTLDDRDRIIRTEQKVDALEARMDGLDKKFDSRVDDLRGEMNTRLQPKLAEILRSAGLL